MVVENASFTVMPRDKAGLVGRNGAGKTSLFKVLGGAVEPHLGKVLRKGGFGYLPQDPKIPGSRETLSAISHVLSGRQIDEDLARIEKLRAAMEASATPQNIAKFSKAEDEFASKGGYAAESEARAIAAGLGLKSDRLSSQLSVLSGGERRRVELARILFAGSDTLLLDEPTNHLDIDAKTWLLGFLRDYRGALLVISHDLELLDEAITRVLHLDRAQEDSVGEIVEYRGTYTQYLSSRAADESRLAKKASLQEKEVARLQGVVDRFGAKASKAAWSERVLTPLETFALIGDEDDIEIYDMRTHEQRKGHAINGRVGVTVKGATSLPLDDLVSGAAELPPSELPVVFVCSKGPKSLDTLDWLAERCPRAVCVEGGITAWDAAALPTDDV